MGLKEKVLTSVVCALATAVIVYSVSTQNFNIHQSAKDRTPSTFLNSDKPNVPHGNLAADYLDGTYEGEAEGFGGTLRVSVVIENGKIKSVEVLSNSETPEYYKQASAVIDEIVSANSVYVDSVSGATITSDAIKEAVYNALLKAVNPEAKNLVQEPPKKEETDEEPASDSKKPAVPGSTVVQTSGLVDGTYIGTGTGLNGTIRVRVTVKNHVLTDIKVLSHSEDSPYFENAMSVIGRILSSGNGNVETVSGATYSSRGIIDAVKDALRQAKEDIGQNQDGSDSSKPDSPDHGDIDSGNGILPDHGNNGGDSGSGDSTVIPDTLDALSVKGTMSDGEYIGYGRGFHPWGTIKTTVTVTDGEVSAIQVAENTSDYADDLDFRDKAMNMVDYLKGENARRTVALANMYQIYKDKLFDSRDAYATAYELFGPEYAQILKEANMSLASTKIKAISKVIKTYVSDHYGGSEMFDAVSGATLSANGIAQSVEDAMYKAVNDATQKNDVKDTLIQEPAFKVIQANRKNPLDLSKLKVRLIKKDDTEELVSVQDFASHGIEMFDAETNAPITNGMSLENYPAKCKVDVIVKHMASITQDRFTLDIGNFSTDYVNQIHYSRDGKTWYRVKDVAMDPEHPENISYLKQVIDAPKRFQYENIKVRVVSESGEMYDYTTSQLAGAGRDALYRVTDAKGNSNVPERLFVQFTFSGTEADKEVVPGSGTTPPDPEKPDSGDDYKEVPVDSNIISSDLDLSKDIDYIDGQRIKPIKFELHDPEAQFLLEVDNLPNGLSFNGSEISGTPELDDSAWNPDYYGGLHARFEIRIKAQKGNVLLVKTESLQIRRDRDRDGIADYNESKKDQTRFNARLTDYSPIEVRGTAPTLKDYSAKIKNLPEKGVTVQILQQPDLSVEGTTSVKLGFKVDGLKDIGEISIKINVITPVATQPEEEPAAAPVDQVSEAPAPVTAEENTNAVPAEAPASIEPEKAETEPAVPAAENDQNSPAESSEDLVVSDAQSQPVEKEMELKDDIT